MRFLFAGSEDCSDNSNDCGSSGENESRDREEEIQRRREERRRKKREEIRRKRRLRNDSSASSAGRGQFREPVIARMTEMFRRAPTCIMHACIVLNCTEM